MSRDDTDFAAYLAARWPALVRTLVLLGFLQATAEALVWAGFVRCYAEWARLCREDDLDTQVFAAVQHGLGRHADLRPAPVPDGTGGVAPDDRDEVLAALLAELDRLGPQAREVLVLPRVAGFDEVQVAEILDLSVAEVAGRGIRARAQLDLTGVGAAAGLEGRTLTSDDAFRLACEAIEVVVPPYAEVVAGARAVRHRRARRGAVVVVAAVVVIGGLTWAGTRTDEHPDDGLGPVPVTRERNPVEVPWYAAGVLHLDRVSMELPHLTDLVEVQDGVVYADTHGVVAFVDAAGRQRLLGHKTDGTPLVGSRETGWVTWVDRDSGLVVDDVDAGSATSPPGRRLSDAVPVAVDLDTVYYRSAGETYAWKPREQVVESLTSRQLLDAASGTRAYRTGQGIELVDPSFGVDRRRAGSGATLSSGGSYVITQQPGEVLPLGAFHPVLYSVGTGVRIPTGFGPDEVALDAVFGDGSAVVYVVARRSDLERAVQGGTDQPLGQLRTCEINGVCSDRAPVHLGGGEPLLAH